MLSFRDSLKKVDYLLALLAGASMVLAFAPFELRAFAWFAPAVLFWLNLKNIPRGQRLRLAWVFGIGLDVYKRQLLVRAKPGWRWRVRWKP